MYIEDVLIRFLGVVRYKVAEWWGFKKHTLMSEMVEIARNVQTFEITFITDTRNKISK